MSKYRTSIREVSTGIVVLAATGLFWFSFAAATASGGWAQIRDDRYNWILFGTVVFVIGTAGLLGWGAIRVRQRAAGFQFELSEDQRVLRKKVLGAYKRVLFAQFVLCALALLLSFLLDRTDLVWPIIAFLVSLHFFHVALVFRLPPYWAIAGLGAVVSGTAILLPVSLVSTTTRQIFLGIGMGAICWTADLYMIINCDRLATRRGNPTRPFEWE